MFAVRDIILYGVLAAIIVALVVAVLPGERPRWWAVIAGLTTLAGWILWNLTLDVTHADGFNTDAPYVGISWADTGSGVFAFVITALVFGLGIARHEPATRIVGLATIVGAIAIIVDVFVL